MATDVLRQHLIDPEICIRCNTCEETCPIDAITHDARNYVVDAAKCNACNACISPCPTGAIDNWRQVASASAYSLDEQLSWDSLPAQEVVAGESEIPTEIARLTAEAASGQGGLAPAPWSAAQPVVNLHTNAKPAIATVTGNHPLTAQGASSDIRHIVLDFGSAAFPVLEGQTIGIVPPGSRRAGAAPLRSPVLRRKPSRRRASGLQQRRADREARDGGSRRQAGARRRVELPVRSRQGRHREGRGTVRRQLPDAQSSRLEPAHDLHRHRLGADARDDRATPPAHRAKRRRRAHAVLRRARSGGAPLLRAAHEAAAGLHRHQSRVLARAGTAQAVRAGPDPHARRRRRAPAARRGLLRLRLRPAQHGARRRARRFATCAARAASTGTRCCPKLREAGRFHLETY